MRRLRWRHLAVTLLLAPAAALGCFLAYVAWAGRDDPRPSVCHGEVGGGRLERGRRLPSAGQNFRAYSVTGYLLGRTFVHSAVREATAAAISARTLRVGRKMSKGQGTGDGS